MQPSISGRAKRLRIFVIVLMVALVAFIAAAWVGPTDKVHIEMHGHAPGVGSKSFATVVILLLELALFELTRMLSLVTSGEYFSVRVIARFRGFALWLLILALIGLIAPMVQLHSNGGFEFHFITINLGELLVFGVTLLLFLLARLLERAGEIEQENREIV
jgi:magnesium-transporting ATPase (P-type)